MFAAERYFAPRYWPPRYFPKVGAVAPAVTAANAVVVVINGVDVSASLMYEGARVSLARNDQAQTAHFSIKPSAAIYPTVGQSFAFGLGSVGNLLMAGQISNVYHRRRKLPIAPWMETIVSFDAWDWRNLFNRRRINRIYRGATISDIAINVINLDTSGFNGDLSFVQTSAVVLDYFPIEDETASEVLTRLVQLNGGGGHFIDPYRRVHFFGPSGETATGMHAAPSTITNNLGTTLDFTNQVDGRAIRNRVIVKGRSTQTMVTVPNDYATVFAHGIPLADNWAMSFVALPGTGVVSIGAQVFAFNDHYPLTSDAMFCTTTSDTAAGATSIAVDSNTELVWFGNSNGRGWAHDEANENCFYYEAFLGTTTVLDGIPASGYGSIGVAIPSGTKLYRLNSVLDTAPADGSTGFDEIPKGETVRVRAVVDDLAAQTALAAIEGGDGIHEHIIDAPDATAIDALDIAVAELANFASETGLTIADWITEDLNALPGARQAINISGTSDNLTVTATIDTVELTFINADYPPIRVCHASDVKLDTFMIALP